MTAITTSSIRNGLPRLLVTSQYILEAEFHQEAISPANAIGIAQVQPATFEEVFPGGDITNIHDNIEAGARYLRKMILRFGGNLRLALAAYNCGPSRTEDKILKISGGYADQIIRDWQKYGGGSGGGDCSKTLTSARRRNQVFYTYR